MTDFVGDMIIRIKNGQRAGLDSVLMNPAMPQYCKKILTILQNEGYIRGFKEIYDGTKGVIRLKVLLKYGPTGTPGVRNIFRVSTPGRRVYLSTKVLWKPRSTSGIFIISTPLGILVDRDARLFNVGGEVLCGLY